MAFFYNFKIKQRQITQPLSVVALFSHKAFCVAMVASVSPSCTKILAKRASSSVVKLQAIAFASAVIDVVSSSEFVAYHLTASYAKNEKCLKVRILHR